MLACVPSLVFTRSHVPPARVFSTCNYSKLIYEMSLCRARYCIRESDLPNQEYHFSSPKSHYSISVSNLWPPPRAGAGGELRGFRRLSPAAADGNELNMSGCLGAGVSEKYGCCSASSADIRLSGSYVRREESRSIPATVKYGNFWWNW